MKINKTVFRILLPLFFACSLLSSCKKYLDQKPLKNQYEPNTLEDLRALLDNAKITSSASASLIAEQIADNYYLTTDNWQSLDPYYATSYLWDGEKEQVPASWNDSYQGAIYFSNLVLEYLPELTDNGYSQNAINEIRGSALFYRAFSFYQIAQLFCKPYDQSSLSDLGIVLRLTSNINIKSVRSTVEDTYQRIIADLKESVRLLPNNTVIQTRPNKASAYGSLSRVFLSMRKYDEAKLYADSCLELNRNVLNFNSLLPLNSPPIKSFNKEVIFHSSASTTGALAGSIAKIDTALYASYNIKDLRKQIFFRANTGANVGTYRFQGSFHGDQGTTSIFNGITVGEILLTRAECLARSGKTQEAMDDLNILMRNRWLNDGSWVDRSAADGSDALQQILIERRKELIYRGLRWSDIRRFNLEGANITLRRIVDKVEYLLPPNDLRTVLLIPFNVVNYSGIKQNPR